MYDIKGGHIVSERKNMQVIYHPWNIYSNIHYMQTNVHVSTV